MNIDYNKIQKIMASPAFRYVTHAVKMLIVFPLKELAVLLALICILNVVEVSWVWFPLMVVKFRVFVVLVWWLWDGVFMDIVKRYVNSRFKL